MNARNIIAGLLVAFALVALVYVFAGERGGDEVTAAAAADGTAASADGGSAATEQGHKVVAWYFHTTKRCPTCIKIESYTRESIEENFAPQLESGALEFRVVNVEDPECEHYIEDYQLTTKSVVITDFVDGEQVDWKNLDKVWEYVGNREIFVDYVRDETAAYLAELLAD